MLNPTQSRSFLARAVMVFGLAGPAGGPGHATATGSLTGTVTFDGAAAPAGVVAGDAVIYLEGDGLAGGPSATGELVLSQADLTFSPHVLTVVAGNAITITNNDAVMHNVHTVSKRNRPINKAQLAGMSAKLKLQRPEFVEVKCDVHSQMSAYVAVVPNRFFARPEADGSYVISDVPAGTYQLVGWHEKYGTVTYNIEVAEGQTVTTPVNFVAN